MPPIHIHVGSDLENSITLYHIFKLQLTLPSAVTWLALRRKLKPDNFVCDWCECSRRAIKKAVAFISSTTAIKIFREPHPRWLFLKRELFGCSEYCVNSRHQLRTWWQIDIILRYISVALYYYQWSMLMDALLKP